MARAGNWGGLGCMASLTLHTGPAQVATIQGDKLQVVGSPATFTPITSRTSCAVSPWNTLLRAGECSQSRSEKFSGASVSQGTVSAPSVPQGGRPTRCGKWARRTALRTAPIQARLRLINGSISWLISDSDMRNTAGKAFGPSTVQTHRFQFVRA